MGSGPRDPLLLRTYFGGVVGSRGTGDTVRVYRPRLFLVSPLLVLFSLGFLEFIFGGVCTILYQVKKNTVLNYANKLINELRLKCKRIFYFSKK